MAVEPHLLPGARRTTTAGHDGEDETAAVAVGPIARARAVDCRERGDSEQIGSRAPSFPIVVARRLHERAANFHGYTLNRKPWPLSAASVSLARSLATTERYFDVDPLEKAAAVAKLKF